MYWGLYNGTNPIGDRTVPSSTLHLATTHLTLPLSKALPLDPSLGHGTVVPQGPSYELKADGTFSHRRNNKSHPSRRAPEKCQQHLRSPKQGQVGNTTISEWKADSPNITIHQGHPSSAYPYSLTHQRDVDIEGRGDWG